MTIGVIGGSGLYDMEGLQNVRMEKVTTPFGDPSDEFVLGTLGDVDLAFLPRHGRGHTILPSDLNFRANIWAMKSLGVERIISLSAVGSLKIEIEPGHAVVIDQFIDRTRGQRANTFFGEGVVAHVAFADPVCGYLADLLYEGTKEIGWTSHKGGTYICMEGLSLNGLPHLRHLAVTSLLSGLLNVTVVFMPHEGHRNFDDNMG